MGSKTSPTPASSIQNPSFKEALAVWAKIGVLSFGGPAGQIALMHRVLVDERRWISDDHFLRALNFCMLLPGPEAMQLAIYVGRLLHGTFGGLVAGLLFVLPGAMVVLALSIAYALFGHVQLVEAAFVGIKAAVLVIVIEALLRVARRALRRPQDWIIAAAAFVGIFFFAVPFPLVIAAAAFIGYVLVESRGQAVSPAANPNPVKFTDTLRTAGLWLDALDRPTAPAPASVWARSRLHRHGHLLFQAGRGHLRRRLFGPRLYGPAGGRNYGWLSAGEMLDGLGLAETTPGPLILVTEFVGFLAGYRFAGNPKLAFGLLGAAVTLWATFVPCFLWIFVGAPYVERLSTNPRLASALSGVTAAVVGVILNLSLWFALHVFFAKVEPVWQGPLRLWRPDPSTLDVEAVVLACLAAVLLLRLKLGIAATLAISAGAALAWFMLTGGA